MKIVSASCMRELDRGTMAAGTPGLLLMERAGLGAFLELQAFVERLPARHRRRLLVLAGKGNNGGDGYVLARHAAAAGWAVELQAVVPTDDLPVDARLQAAALPAAVRHLVGAARLPDEALAEGTVVVDALLGTGVAGPLREPYATWIAQVNGSGLPVVALDLPSGLDADTGTAAGLAMVADLTLTMGLPKQGLLTPAGLAACGRLRCIDIGLDAELVAAAPAAGEAVFAQDIRAWLGRRPAAGHKGTFGQVLVVGGSTAYAGAPVLAGAAALRGGCGLATIAVPASLAGRLPSLPKALIVQPLADRDGHLARVSVPQLRGLRRPDVVVLGPGLGISPAALPVLGELLSWPLPVVVDADALRLLASLPQLLAGRVAPTILTPHPGEMRALVEGLGLTAAPEDRLGLAAAVAAATGCQVIFKGLGTILAAPDGRCRINASGGNALATAGSGDVLAGLVAAFLAAGLAVDDAMAAGVFLHGRAGELSPHGDRAFTADDLLEAIPVALRDLSPLA